MKVAVSVTKIIEMPEMGLAELAKAVDDDPEWDWYDWEAEQEVWSYAIIDE